jgi:23S rRNA pseudouridine1911/1915/1917 synthase
MEDSFRLLSEEDDVRIDVYLSERLSLPRSRIKSLIDKGHVRVENRIAKPSFKLKKNLSIEGEIVREEVSSLAAEDIPLTILYEDEYLLVIDKPSDMVVHPSLGHRAGTLVNAILNHIHEEGREGDERPGIVHRLDKGTTGVIVVAKDGRTQEALSRQFHERSVEKVYRAVVEGLVRDQEGIVEGAIGRHPVERKRMAMVEKGGRHSFSFYQVIERLKGFTYLEIHPKTGRTHQIRVHMNSLGHPIVGDDLYGKRAKRLADRPLLHALRIAFDHPAHGRRVIVEAPVPADMEAFLREHRGPDRP